jgi:sugar phosphate isomerase/epimerase
LGIAILKKNNLIRPEMTVLDVLSRYRETEKVFKLYDKQAGECICCQALFEPLRNVAATYGLNMEKLLTDLEAAAGQRSATPKLVMCNFFSDTDKLKKFAREHGFSGIDFSFDLQQLPGTPAQESKWVKDISALVPLEVRYHCPFDRIDLGHDDPEQARAAKDLFCRVIRLISKVGGRYITIHIGLGHDFTEPLSWETTIDNLRQLVDYGRSMSVRVCLENLAWGWTSKANLFEKLIRRSGADVTLDIGHAYACESVQSQQYTVEDFVTPHADRVFNAHIYHTEIPGQGHIPPEKKEDIEDRLSLLNMIGCNWWVIEIREVEGLLKTKKIVDEFLVQENLVVKQMNIEHRTSNIE